jgi:lipoprotein-anchoring transpeptidase ErfK/SrfK
VLEDVVFEFEPVKRRDGSLAGRSLDFIHRHSLSVFALLFLLIASSGILVGRAYWLAHISLAETSASSAVHVPALPDHGPNAAVINDELGATIQQVTGQAFNLTIGSKTVPVSGDTIKSWLQIVNDKSKGVSYIHVNQTAISKSLNDAAAPFLKAPVNQVAVTNADGTSRVIGNGRDGLKLSDTSAVTKQIGDGLLSAKGFQLTLPTETQPFSSISAASIDKLIEVNVATKQMYLFDKGQLTRSYPISAGAAATPTPIGQFQIYQKLPVQDMRGFNVNGTKYFQPHVHWINYFLPGGYAVHGVYWHGSSWFGNINSSHGCVGLPDDQAEWVYNWAPIGTTVITHV